MIKAERLSKTYILKKKKHFWNKASIEYKEAVVDVSIDIEKGKIVGLLGVNGAGKTSTIKILSTMIEPTSGEINIDGINAIKNPMIIKKNINLITGGERNIYWRLTARENLQYFGSLYGLSGQQLKKNIEQCLYIVQLEEIADIPVEKYSKGMKQRLQIARGLINNPDYIFLDEPTLGLDIIIAKELRNYVRQLAVTYNKGILLTTHYISEAEELCDYIYIIDKGRIIAQGAPYILKQQYSKSLKTQLVLHDWNKDFISSLNSIQNILSVNESKETHEIEITSSSDIISDCLALADQLGVKIIKIMLIEPKLEDSLLAIMGANHEI
jgi:ABC-2 type transport system ATP-binding protein